MSKSYFNLREALEIGTNKIVDEYKKATPGQVAEAPEDDMPASPDEAGMAMDQAKFIGYVAEEIMEYIEGNNEFPEWMQNKLSALHEKAKGMHAVMAGKYESVQEAKFTDKQIKMAYGIANDKRYKGGNYTGAVNAIEKIAKGLSDHPDVKKVLKVTNESLRSDIAAMSAKFPEGSKVKMKHDGKIAKVVSVGKDFVKVAVGNKTMDHKPSELEKLDEAAYKVPNNYAAMKARMNKNKKVTDAQINKVLGPTKNAQQGVEALKKAFKVTDDEAKAMIGRVMPTEANRGSDSYRVKYKGDINTVRADSPEDALKKSMKAFGIGSMNKSDYMKNASAISEESSVSEKLTVADGLGAWIKDFQASDSPQFADKDDEEIRNMAIAAFLAAKREAKKGGDTSESSKAYGKTMSKQRDDKKKAGITDKDKQTLGKLADLMKREKR